jgi:hypothetical protein
VNTARITHIPAAGGTVELSHAGGKAEDRIPAAHLDPDLQKERP